jgi:hypothetical protein
LLSNHCPGTAGMNVPDCAHAVAGSSRNRAVIRYRAMRDTIGRLTWLEWWQNAGALVWTLVALPYMVLGVIGLLTFLLAWFL